MFGTMVTFKPKTGKEAAFREFVKSGAGLERAKVIPGFVSEFLLEPADPAGEWIMFIVFTSEDAYRTNAADPAQHENFLEFLELLDSPPTWHDGSIEQTWPIS